MSLPLTIDTLSTRPTSGLSEGELVRGYALPAPVLRTVLCACGGSITATSGDDVGTMAAVAAHNETPVHRLWRVGR